MRKFLFMMIAMIFIVSSGSNLVGDRAFEILDVSSVTFFSDLLLQFGQLSSSLSGIISSSFSLLSQTLTLGLSLLESVTAFFSSIQPVMDAFMESIVPLMQKVFDLLNVALSGIVDFCNDMREPIQEIGDWLSKIFGSIGRFFKNFFA